MKLKPALPWKSQDVGHASARDTCSEKLLIENGTRPRQRSVLQPTKLNGVRDLKSILTSDMEMQSLEFAQLVFVLALVQYFLTMLPSIHLEMVMCISCAIICWKYYDLFLILISLGILVKRLYKAQKRF